METQIITLLIVVSILGLLNSGFLVYKHYAKKKVVCPLGNSCSLVLESKWGKIFKIKNEVIGIIFYFLIAASALIYFISGGDKIILAMRIASGLASLMSLFLLYIQAFVLRNYCFYCILSALNNLVISGLLYIS